MQFVKMHGLGNDYVYVNGLEFSVDSPGELSKQIADRHFGVGADGLILILPPDPDQGSAHVRMRMFNADGSEAEMCGNGIRCVCKMAHDHGISRENPMLIQTGNGVLTLSYTLDGQAKVEQVTVDMGQPILEPAQIPVNLPQRVVDYEIGDLVDFSQWAGSDQWLSRSGLNRRITCVSMGNPHVVLYADDVSCIPLEQIGPVLETLAVFPNRINVHVVQVHSPTEATMRTWERGSGITLACGTGACAVCVAGVLTGRTERGLCAHLPGGDLQLEWRESDDHVYMTGPATEVFTGVWPE